MQIVIQMETSGSWFVRKKQELRGKQVWFGWNQKVTGTVVPAVGAAGLRQEGSGEEHQEDLSIASHGLPCTELSQELQSFNIRKMEIVLVCFCLCSTC